MTTRRRSRSSSPRRGARKATLWLNTASVPATIGAGVIANLSLAGSGVVQPEVLSGGFTCLRIFPTLSIVPDVAGQNVFGSWGIYVCTDAVSIVQPIFDLLDYYVHRNHFARSGDTEQNDFNGDIRTARKVRGENRLLRFTFEAAGGSGSCTMRFSARMLLQPL